MLGAPDLHAQHMANITITPTITIWGTVNGLLGAEEEGVGLGSGLTRR